MSKDSPEVEYSHLFSTLLWSVSSVPGHLLDTRIVHMYSCPERIDHPVLRGIFLSGLNWDRSYQPSNPECPNTNIQTQRWEELRREADRCVKKTPCLSWSHGLSRRHKHQCGQTSHPQVQHHILSLTKLLLPCNCTF
jgi:hypothetical protein